MCSPARETSETPREGVDGASNNNRHASRSPRSFDDSKAWLRANYRGESSDTNAEILRRGGVGLLSHLPLPRAQPRAERDGCSTMLLPRGQ